MFKKVKGMVQRNFPLKTLNTWKIGGSARYYIIPADIQDIQYIIEECHINDVPFVILGQGSNVLIDDSGFNGVVIHFKNTMKNIIVNENSIYAEAGVSLPKFSLHMAQKNITGYHFFAGIPGTVGGAIVMNAGCIGSDTASVLIDVTYLTENGELICKKNEELGFNFRKSCFINSGKVILSARFKLGFSSNKEELMEMTKKAIQIRKEKFPLNVATAGSTFKSPPSGPYPGKLIEEVGLKGLIIGGAQVSPIHGNWIINLGNATSDDIKELINTVQREVKEKTGVELEPEVIYV